MQCPVCNHLNTATSVRCFQCRTTLIHEAVGHSEGYKKTTADLDKRMYSGLGALFGFFAMVVPIKFIFSGASLTDREIYLIGVSGAAAGAFLGRRFLRLKRGEE